MRPCRFPLLSLGLCLCLIQVEGLFEDQAFKFDWRKVLVGKPMGARLWENSQGRLAL